MVQDFESFETVEEIGKCIDNASTAFRSSPDFAKASEGTMDYIMTLMGGLAAMSRISRIEIQSEICV